jgi:phage-related protein
LTKFAKLRTLSFRWRYKLSKVTVVIYCDEKGQAPFLEWFDRLSEKVQDKCTVRIERLEECGNELKRPEADYLSDGIYELRFKHLSVNYRVLYFFHGKQMVVLSHAIMKQRSDVPEREIKIAVERMRKFIASPLKHTFED